MFNLRTRLFLGADGFAGRRHFLAQAAIVSLALTVTGTAEAAAPPQKIETIVVTARKRVENVHDVPISMSTISADQIANRGASDLRDLDGTVPNMVETGLASNINPLVSIRGISSDSRNIGFESGV